MMAPTGNVIQIRGNMEKIMDMFEAGSSYADIAKAVGKTERDIEVIIHYIYRQNEYMVKDYITTSNRLVYDVYINGYSRGVLGSKQKWVR